MAPLASVCLVMCVLVATPAPARSGARARSWRRVDLTPVTQPIAVAGRFVIYDGSAGQLRVVALDARTGATAWSLLASVSKVTPGVAPALYASGSNVIVLLSTSSGPGVAVVAAVDATTGHVVWASAPGLFTSTPTPCPGEPKVVCATGTLASGRASGNLRFDLSTGRTLAPAPFAGQGARQIGDGLVDPGVRKPDYLVATRGSAIAWRVPLARIFGADSSTDTGWDFERFAKLGLFVGSVGYPPLKTTSTYGIFDLSRQMSAGFRIADGTVVWRNRGALFACGLLPCPGIPLGLNPDPARHLRSKAVVGVRLRMTGSVKATYAGKITMSPDATATLEGFEPATGRTIWRFAAGHSAGLISQTLHAAQTSRERIVLKGRSGIYTDLDLRTGARHQVARTTRGWCRGRIVYHQNVPYQASGKQLTVYVGQGSLFPCLVTGKRLPTPSRAPALVAAIGATARGIVAWTDATGVIAVPAA